MQFLVSASNPTTNGAASEDIQLATIIQHFSSFSADVEAVAVGVSDSTCLDVVTSDDIPGDIMIAPGETVFINGTRLDVNICNCPEFVFTFGATAALSTGTTPKNKNNKNNNSDPYDVCAAVASVVFPSATTSLSAVPSSTPSVFPSTIPLAETPCKDSTNTLSNLLANATNLPSTTIDCSTNVVYPDSGVFIFNANSTCGASVQFSGNNQILDCQGNTVGTNLLGIFLIQFLGSGPYIVRNCQLLAPTPEQGGGVAIFASGSADGVLETVDILIKETSIHGQDLSRQSGAVFFPSSEKPLCVSITESVFMDLEIGVIATTSSTSQLFLDLLDVSLSSNTIGLIASGSRSQLDVKDSLFCSATTDVILQSGATGSFSNNICSTTDPTSQKSEICSMDCAGDSRLF